MVPPSTMLPTDPSIGVALVDADHGYGLASFRVITPTSANHTSLIVCPDCPIRSAERQS